MMASVQNDIKCRWKERETKQKQLINQHFKTQNQGGKKKKKKQLKTVTIYTRKKERKHSETGLRIDYVKRQSKQ